MYFTHRLSAWLWLGFDLERHLLVLHKCDKPRCFSPAHLFIGTQSRNMLDMLDKGRAWTNKLTAKEVTKIRANTDHRTIVIAQRYGVTAQTIRDIKRRRSWKHVA